MTLGSSWMTAKLHVQQLFLALSSTPLEYKQDKWPQALELMAKTLIYLLLFFLSPRQGEYGGMEQGGDGGEVRRNMTMKNCFFSVWFVFTFSAN